jgi:hypothetical protein
MDYGQMDLRVVLRVNFHRFLYSIYPPQILDAQLEGMGFDRALVLEVFFACNKNEQLAANYLLDHMHEFDNDDGLGGPPL